MKTQQNAEENTSKVGIVINRMYVGDYLSENLGHEVINFFKADNGRHYIYLNATGNFAKEHENKIGYMLFVKYYDKGLVEIIGMAKGLEEVPGANMSLNRSGVDMEIWKMQKDYIDKERGISYAGVSILDIFNNTEQQSIFITYKADKVYRIKSSIRRFIRFSNADENRGSNLPTDEVIQLGEHKQAKASLKQYIYPSDSSDYNSLFALFNDSSLWEDEVVDKVNVENLSIKSQRKVSIFDICKIQNNENCFSDALKYFMKQSEYYELWKEFFAKYGINLKKNFTVAREESAKIESTEWNHEEKPSGGRVDLLIRDGENIVVIENKIKSDINTIATDGDDSTQLNRYVNYVNWLVKNNEGAKPHFIILTPSYNSPTIKDENMAKMYSIIKYADLYNFLEEHLFSFYNDANFVAFFEAMHRHTHKNVNDYLYYEMLEKFVRRINEATK